MVLGAFGVYFLVKTLRSREVAFLAAIFYALGPIIPFLFRFSSPLNLITFSFLPYVLLSYVKFLEKRTRKSAGLCILSISLIMLVSVAILPSLVLGMVAIFLATSGWESAEEGIKQTFQILFFALLISTVWYTPGYWWRLLFAPSFAGKPLFKVISELAQLLPVALAIGLAVVSGKIIKSGDRALKFCFYWLFLFGFLTLVRFISDPDFWMDWSAYSTELQLGLAILVGIMLVRVKKAYVFTLFCSLALCIFLFVLTVDKYVLGTLQRDITGSVEYRIGEFLSEAVKPGERVFLSGSSIFWLNAFFDVVQVRGGADQAAVHPTWDKAAWELREGTDIQKSVRWLDELKIDYLVVHTSASSEYYHDFVYPEKFEETTALEKIYDYQGDRIYRRY